MLNSGTKTPGNGKFIFTTESCGKFVCNKDETGKPVDQTI
jgi:hypothetical protein